MTAEGKNEGYLIVNHDYRFGRQTAAPDFVFEPIKRFPEAFVSDERYVIYLVRHGKIDVSELKDISCDST